jgi:hypothetical protein
MGVTPLEDHACVENLVPKQSDQWGIPPMVGTTHPYMSALLLGSKLPPSGHPLGV